AEIAHIRQVRALAAEEVAHLGPAVGPAAAEAIDPLAHRQPSIREKSATVPSVARISESSRRRLTRRSGSSQFTVTPSKKPSTGRLSCASAAIAPEKSSAARLRAVIS